MPDSRTGLIEAARALLEIAAREPATEDPDGAEIQALYGTLKHTNVLLQSYTIRRTTPELRSGARSASAELQRAMWMLEDAWLQRYSHQPAQNIVPIPLRRTA